MVEDNVGSNVVSTGAIVGGATLVVVLFSVLVAVVLDHHWFNLQRT